MIQIGSSTWVDRLYTPAVADPASQTTTSTSSRYERAFVRSPTAAPRPVRRSVRATRRSGTPPPPGQRKAVPTISHRALCVRIKRRHVQAAGRRGQGRPKDDKGSEHEPHRRSCRRPDAHRDLRPAEDEILAGDGGPEGDGGGQGRRPGAASTRSPAAYAPPATPRRSR